MLNSKYIMFIKRITGNFIDLYKYTEEIENFATEGNTSNINKRQIVRLKKYLLLKS